MIRVAHIALQLQTGGLERLLTEYARHADRSRFELHFVAMGPDGRLGEEIRGCGWPVTALNVPPGVRPSAVGSLARLLRGFDVVHTHNTKPLLYAGPAARLARAGAVVHTRHGQRRGATALQHTLFRLASRCADRMVCVSRDAAGKCLREGVDPVRVRTIHNGIDTARFAFSGARAGGPAVYVGRLSPEKDVATLLRAAELAPSLEVWIAGDGPCRAGLESRAAGMEGRVRFLGEVADVPGLLAKAGLFVLPSLSEGMPVTVLEAMAVGLPVVATAVGGTPEAVEHGVTGELVAAGDAPALAGSMVRVADGRGVRMGEAGRRRVEAEFDVRTMVGRYESMYERVLRRAA